MLTEEHLEWLMLTASEAPESLSDDRIDDIIDRFTDWPGKTRVVPL